MTKEDKPKEKTLEDLFDEAEVISAYSDREAVADGVLFDVNELGKISPSIPWCAGPFQYVTTNLCNSKGYMVDGVPQVANFLDLFTSINQVMRKAGPDHFYSAKVEFPDGTNGDVYAVQNNSKRRYTILLPEDY